MSGAQPADGGEERLREAAARGAAHLARLQSGDGTWPNLLEAGPYLDVLHGLPRVAAGQQESPFPGSAQTALGGNGLLAQQNDDGGFSMRRGGPSCAEATCEAWLALRLAGLNGQHPALRRAAAWLAGPGGALACDFSTLLKFAWAGAAVDGRLAMAAPEHYFFFDYSRWPAAVRQQEACRGGAGGDSLPGGEPDRGTAPRLRRWAAELPARVCRRSGVGTRGRTAALIAKWASLASAHAARSFRVPQLRRDGGGSAALAVAAGGVYAALAVQAAGGRGSETMGRFEQVISGLATEDAGTPARPCDWSWRGTALATLALGGGDAAARPPLP